MAEILLAVQAATASVAGTVRDQVTGEPLATVVVTLTDLDRTVVTDADGRYGFRAVPAGPQHLVVRRIGYEPRTMHALVPRQGPVVIDIVLHPHPISLRAIAARVHLPIRGVEDDSAGFPDRTISMAAVRHHPLLAEADALQALSGGEVVVRPEAPSGIHVRGGASDQVAYLLDGIPVFSPYHAAGTLSAWNPDALAQVELRASSPASPATLSGVVWATTKSPGAHVGMQGGVSTTHARLTIDGPLGRGGAGYLVSTRSGFAGFPIPRRESSYLRGETGDWLAKLEVPVAGGHLRLLGYGNDDELDAAAVATSEVAPAAASSTARNEFVWHSRSVGGEWTQRVGRVGIEVRAWSAIGGAGSLWHDADSAQNLAAERREVGLLAAASLAGARTRTTAGVLAQRTRTSYRGGVALFARTPVVSGFVRHLGPVFDRIEIDLGLSAALAVHDVHFSPRVHLRWRPTATLTLSGGYARLHQFAQSLRNPESVVGTVFPVDLSVGAGSQGVPVARSRQGIFAVEYRPAGGVRVAAQGYSRALDGLVLVAPQDADPFATSGFRHGSGRARGASIEMAAAGARYGVVVGYGLQHVRYAYGDSSYVPDHGVAQSLDAGVIAFPSPTFSFRVGAIGVLGRHATAVTGPLEWESCNALDQGCEFGGSPQRRLEPLGATSLPPYLRVDLGLRKHWHVSWAGRDGQLAVFGTLTNLFGRVNVLTFASDPSTGERSPVEMRAFAPLVVGIDWRF